MTSEEIAQARRLCEQATAGPWRSTTQYHPQGIPEGRVFGPDCVVAVVGAYHDPELLPFSRSRWDADKQFIAAARTLLPRLLDALEDRERAYNAALTYLFHALPFEQQQRWGGDAEEFIEGVQFAVARAAPPAPEGEP
jgi:hypothetical protein